MAWKTADPTRTLHKADCRMAFGRKDQSCPRCMELINGQAPRAGWGDQAARFRAQSLAAIKAHDCKASNCMSVCTFGDW
jgi:hypothetical protein